MTATKTAPTDVPGMRRVTEAEFFARMGPLDVHPSLHQSPFYSSWETRDRVEVGRSFPGWKNPGDPEAYFLAD